MRNCGVHTNTNRCYSSQPCTPTRNAKLPTRCSIAQLSLTVLRLWILKTTLKGELHKSSRTGVLVRQMLAATNPDPRFTEELSFQPPPQPPCRTCDRGRKAHEATAGHPQNQKRGPWRLGPGPLPTQSACAAGSGAPPARGSAPLRSGAPARRPRLNPSSPGHAAAAPRGPGPLRTETLPQVMAGAFPPYSPCPLRVGSSLLPEPWGLICRAFCATSTFTVHPTKRPAYLEEYKDEHQLVDHTDAEPKPPVGCIQTRRTQRHQGAPPCGPRPRPTQLPRTASARGPQVPGRDFRSKL